MSPSAVSVFAEKKPFLSFDWSKPVFCIGPSTAIQAKKAGFLQVRAPEEYTQEGIFHSICRYYKEE
jgi:uroporphyrinogen-III synthase